MAESRLVYYYARECPDKERCSRAAWKKAKVWGNTEAECAESLRKHLTRSSLHNDLTPVDIERLVFTAAFDVGGARDDDEEEEEPPAAGEPESLNDASWPAPDDLSAPRGSDGRSGRSRSRRRRREHPVGPSAPVTPVMPPPRALALRPPAPKASQQQIPPATAQALVAVLEQAALALGHAQMLSLQASQAFCENQAAVRRAINSLKEVISNNSG